MPRRYFVYILASDSRQLYVGVTNSLSVRLAQHRAGLDSHGYTTKHCIRKLVYCEESNDILAAIRREKQIKVWTRAKKVRLIESLNPEIYPTLGEAQEFRPFAALRVTFRALPLTPGVHHSHYIDDMHVIFVCTGNTCRSPMAEALLREALTSRGAEQITVGSAGTGAWDGAPVSEGAYLVGLEHGLDLSGHRARLLTRDVVKSADLILTMSGHHRARVAELGGEDKVHVLGEYAGREEGKSEVSDPFGSDLASYRMTWDELNELIGNVVSRVAGRVR